MKNLFSKLTILIATLVFSSCGKDYLSTVPVNQLTEAEMFKNIANTRVALSGAYAILYKQISGQEQDGHTSIMFAMDLMGEDMVWSKRGTDQFYGVHRLSNHTAETGGLNAYAYRLYYRIIANANIILEKVDTVPDATELDKQTIKGQCLGLRAFAYHMLVQLFGPRFDLANAAANETNMAVPLVLTYSLDAHPKASVKAIYNQIDVDLDNAIILLDGISTNSTFRTRIDKKVLQGLKARVALSQGKYQDAYNFATLASVGSELMSNADILRGFTSLDNDEWIWGVNVLDQQLPTAGSFYAFMSSNFNSAHTRTNPKLINSILYNLISATDVRKKWWCDDAANVKDYPGVIDGISKKPIEDQVRFKYMQNKFRVKSPASRAGDIPFMRLAEMLLIRAEAKAMLAEVNGGDATLRQEAADILYVLAKNRDPQYVAPTNLTGILTTIKNHRRIELWGEGFRFLDLKRRSEGIYRSNTGATVTYARLLSVAATDATLWQFGIPLAETNANPYIDL